MTARVARPADWTAAASTGRQVPPFEPGRFLVGLAREALPGMLGLAVLLITWEAWVRLEHVKPYLVPAPSRVAARLYAHPNLFGREGFHTLEGAGLGFALGALIAFLLASVMAQSRWLERAIFPLAILVK